MKLGYQCENNNHKECGGRWIENPDTNEEKTFFCDFALLCKIGFTRNVDLLHHLSTVTDYPPDQRSFIGQFTAGL
jgi:hypothetical protein